MVGLTVDALNAAELLEAAGVQPGSAAARDLVSEYTDAMDERCPDLLADLAWATPPLTLALLLDITGVPCNVDSTAGSVTNWGDETAKFSLEAVFTDPYGETQTASTGPLEVPQGETRPWAIAPPFTDAVSCDLGLER